MKLQIYLSKVLFSTLLVWALMLTQATAQETPSNATKADEIATQKTKKRKIQAAAKPKPAVAQEVKPVATRTSPNGSLQAASKTGTVENQPVIKYEKTGDPVKDMANYQKAKKAYLAKHPELQAKQVTKQKISKKDYDNLPPARKAVIDAHPEQYQIGD